MITLDHVGLAVPALDAAMADWRRIGFAPLDVAHHAAPGPDGAPRPTGTGKSCIMLRQGYLELLAVVDPAQASRTIAGFLARYTGIHVVSFATDDLAAAQARLRRAGFETDIITSERAADPKDPDGPQARFQRVALTALAPRLQILQHLTPELVWQERFLVHPNRAVALDSVIVAAADPAVLAAALSRTAGVPVRPDPAGGFVLPLAAGRVRVLPPDAVAVLLPGLAQAPPPFVAGIVLRTDDANRAAAALPGALPVPGGHLLTASGTGVLFTPA